MSADATVFVVDDSPSVRKSLRLLFGSAGFETRTYDSARAFLDDYEPEQPGCLVLDLRLRDENGLDLQDEMRRRRITLPVIVVTGHGSVPASVRAMKGGALDFLEKPVRPSTLIARVTEALDFDRSARAEAARRGDVDRRIGTLTPRERDVMALMVTGKTSKEIAVALEMSSRTAEGHRRVILRKMQVGSATALARLLGPS